MGSGAGGEVNASEDLTQAASGAVLAAHTPGPWLWQRGEDGLYVVWTRQPHTGELATVNPSDINGRYPAKANARLISAAPDLLEMLRLCASQFRAYERMHRAKKTPDADEKAEVNAKMASGCEAAIAKAISQ